MAKIAINGLGRIGRAALKIILDTRGLELVAVNDLVPPDNLAYLIKYDTVYGGYGKPVTTEGMTLSIGEHVIKVLSEKDPARLPWKELGVRIVLECTGKYTKKEDALRHIEAGAKNVIISAPSKSEGLHTIVYGTSPKGGEAQIISCASCTTNCITPVVEVMARRIGIKKAVMTSLHAYTSSQSIVDGPNKRFRRGRAAACNFVPATTGAAVATTKVLPQLAGKFNGVAVRGPVPAGSIADIVFVTERNTTVEEINKMFAEESESKRYRGILGITRDEIVSSDIIGDTRASIVDLTMTQVVDGDLVKVMSWYDNEWGYSAQMVREAAEIAQASLHE